MKNNILLMLCMASASILSAQPAKIKLYAMYTESHAPLAHTYFLPSICDDYEVIIKKFEQQTDSHHEFMKQGWIQAIHNKIDFIIDAIAENIGSIIIYSDVDIQFFAPSQETILKTLADTDFAIQKEEPKGSVCTGFFACRAHEKTLNLWKAIKQFVINNPQYNDQHAFNYLVRNTNQFNISWHYLPENFFGGGTFTDTIWKPGDSLRIPENPIMHHANYTVSVAHKIAQLEYVQKKVTTRSMQT